MEQIEGGDLIVNRGNESKPKEGNNKRDLNAVEGYESAVKLAQVYINSPAILLGSLNTFQKTLSPSSPPLDTGQRRRTCKVKQQQTSNNHPTQPILLLLRRHISNNPLTRLPPHPTLLHNLLLTRCR